MGYIDNLIYGCVKQSCIPQIYFTFIVFKMSDTSTSKAVHKFILFYYFLIWVIHLQLRPKNTSYKSVKIYNPIDITIYNLLVGGLEHQFYFSIYWEFHDPNWRTYIFQRAGSTTNQFLTGKRHDISMASGANPFPAGPELPPCSQTDLAKHRKARDRNREFWSHKAGNPLKIVWNHLKRL